MLLLLACASPTSDSGVAEGDVEEGPLVPLFTFAIVADPHVTTPGVNADRLAQALDWIDTNREAQDIQLVIVVGDIGWGDEGLALSHDLLASLTVPWVPILGDNEIQYGSEEGFDTTYAEHFATLGATLENFRRGSTPVDNPEYGVPSWFQDLSFDFRGVHFIGLDWCSREIGTIYGEMADLHQFAGGTWGWLEADLAELGEGPIDRVVLASHNPMHLSPGAFDLAEIDTLDALLAAYDDALYANFAGHYHATGEDPPSDRPIGVYVTDATWDDELSIRLVAVSGNDARITYEHTLVTIE